MLGSTPRVSKLHLDIYIPYYRTQPPNTFDLTIEHYKQTFAIMSAQNSKGIQTLLDAEREAQKIVQKAREYRSKRVKDAKNEAQKEIDEYRQQKDKEFKEYETKQTSGNKKAEEEASKDAEEQVRKIKEAGEKTGDKVVEELLRVVTDVKPEVPDRISALSKA